MRINGKYECKRALIIEPEHLKELEKIVKKYYVNIRYRAETKSGSEITFENLNELLKYENHMLEKIAEITIYGELDYDSTALAIYIRPHLSFLFNYGSTIDMQFLHKTTNSQTVFRDQVKKIIAKMHAPLYLSFASKVSLMCISLGLLLTITIMSFFVPSGDAYLTISTVINMIVIGVIIVVLFNKVIFGMLWPYLFPPIVFLWGEEVKKYKSMAGWRSGIFWSVIVASILSTIFLFVKK